MDVPSIFNILVTAKLEYIGLSIMIIPLIIMIRGLRWKWILDCYQIKMVFRKSCKICLLSTVAVSAVPMLGNFIKVFYLPRQDVGVTRPLLSVFMEKYLDTIMPLGFGLGGILAILTGVNPVLSLPLAFIILGALFFVFRTLPRILRIPVINRFLERIIGNRMLPAQVDVYLSELEKSINCKTYCMTIMEFMVTSNLTMFLFVKALGFELDLASLLLVSSVNSSAALIPVSYFGIGIRDVLLIGVYHLLDGSSETAVALSLTILSYHLFICLAGAIVWFLDPPPIKQFIKTVSKKGVHQKT